MSDEGIFICTIIVGVVTGMLIGHAIKTDFIQTAITGERLVWSGQVYELRLVEEVE